ncbi:carboxypeptidase-like regulatory domain-containing protein [Myxococcota bacterium]|nr:carboxypeptidase-like regulatory domain-containing protein [Myxococcota bacterium]
MRGLRLAVLAAAACVVSGAGECGGTDPPDDQVVTVRVHVVPSDDAYAAHTFDTEIAPKGGEAALDRALVLGTRFSGTLGASGPDGADPVPVAGTVFLSLPGTVSSRGTTVGSDGAFALDGIYPTGPDEGYTLRAHPAAGTDEVYSQQVEGLAVQGAEPVDVVLTAGARATARVLRLVEGEAGIEETGAGGLRIEPVAWGPLDEWEPLGPSDDTDSLTGLFTLGLTDAVEALRISSPSATGPALPTVVVTGASLPGDLLAGDGTSTLFTYPLIGAVTASGLVTDSTPEPNAAPVDDAEVRVEGTAWFDDGTGQIASAPFTRRTRTDSGGRYLMEVPDGEYVVSIVPGYGTDVSATTFGGDVPLTAASLTNRQFVLPARLPLRGGVYDPDGLPVEGARVRIRSLGPSGHTWSTTTGADGRFQQLADVGPVEVVVRPPTASSLASPAATTGTNQDGQPSIEVTLEEAVRIGGRVTYFSGGIANVRVLIADPDTGEVLGEGLTDSSGYYEARVRESWVRAR